MPPPSPQVPARRASRLLRFLAVAGAGWFASAQAAEGAAADGGMLQAVVRLPEFQVFETRPLPTREAWDYVKVGNVEILSNAPAGTTRDFARDLGRFQAMLQVVAPAMLIRAEQPVMVVLCGKGGHYERFIAEARDEARRIRNVSMVRDVEIAAIVVDYERRTVAAPDLEVASLGPDGRLTRIFDGVGTGQRPALTMAEFSRQYVLLSLSEMQPRLPAWAAEGLATVYGAIEYADKWIEIGSPRLFAREIEEVMVTPALQMDIASLQNRAGAAGPQAREDFGTGTYRWPTVYAIERPTALLKMGALLAVGYDDRQRGGVAPDTARASYRWRQQCAAFVHLCLYGAGGKFRAGFVKFATRTATEGPTEALFRECFGIDFGEMELRIRAHWDNGTFDGRRIESKEGGLAGTNGRPPLRPATDGEIGRIKGETFRLTGQDEAARQEFVTAYLRGERDPQLLASLGLMARQRHDAARARTYLEAVGAATTPVPRPRAYLELARLRAEGIRGTDGSARYNMEATIALLTPLFRAQRLPQQLSLIYREIADVWASSAMTPDREHLGAIEHGVALFPYDGELAAKTATLLRRHGHPADAKALIERALPRAFDPTARAKLEELGKSL